MDIYLVIYLAVVFIVMFVDATVCLAISGRYFFWLSFIGAIVFPISVTLIILTAPHLTKTNKKINIIDILDKEDR